MKSNFVIIVRDITKDFEKVCKLSKNNPHIEWYWDKGFVSIVGNFDEKKIEKYEHYDLSVATDQRSKTELQDKLPED